MDRIFIRAYLSNGVGKYIFPILACLSFLLLSCKINRHESAATRLHKIAISTGGCFGECAFQAIELNEDLEYHYYGGLFAEKQGYYTGKLPDTIWSDITRRLYELQFQQLDTTYQNTTDDLRIEAVFTYGKNRRKHIMAYWTSLPDSLGEVVEYLLSTPKFIHLTKTDTPHEFDTKIHERSRD